MACARSFGAVVTLSDSDLSLFQEAVTTGMKAGELHLIVPNTVMYLAEMMTEEQKNWRGFERWYRVMMDFVVFVTGEGTEEGPIIVED